MKTKLSNKLTLNKKTVADLNIGEMNALHGGSVIITGWTDCRTNCVTDCIGCETVLKRTCEEC